MIHLTFDYKTDEKCTTPGQYLKYHRTFQGLSTRELAEKVGIVPATLVLYENDRHPIKYSTAVALANVLGIDRNRLLDEYTAFVDYPYFSLLKKVRQDLSLTQIQMAELIGIGQTSYDISQTTARDEAQPQVSYDGRLLLKGLIASSPVPIRAVEELPQGRGLCMTRSKTPSW